MRHGLGPFPMKTLPLAVVTLVMLGTSTQYATAQVLITEVQSDPESTGTDDAEWVEIHNTGSSSTSIAGWTLNDYSGSNEAAARWTFPSGTELSAGEVIVVARYAEAFFTTLGITASWEQADDDGDDSGGRCSSHQSACDCDRRYDDGAEYCVDCRHVVADDRDDPQDEY